MSLKSSVEFSQFKPSYLLGLVNAKASSLDAAPTPSLPHGSPRACYSPPSILAQFLVPQSTYLSMAGQGPLSPHLLWLASASFPCPNILDHLFIYSECWCFKSPCFCTCWVLYLTPLHFPPANLSFKVLLHLKCSFTFPERFLIFLSSPIMKVTYFHHGKK